MWENYYILSLEMVYLRFSALQDAWLFLLHFMRMLWTCTFWMHYGHFFFLIFIFIFERCKQIERRILQWNAIRELYISICKIYLKKESTCPFVHLQLQTEKISEERSRWHRRALWKKVNHLKESLLQMRRFWHSEEIRVVVIMTPNHSWVEPIYFTFHSSLLISEKSENDREGRKLIQREVFHGWMELKKVEWTFSVLENVHLHLQIALLQFTWQRKLFRAFKG